MRLRKNHSRQLNSVKPVLLVNNSSLSCGWLLTNGKHGSGARLSERNTRHKREYEKKAYIMKAEILDSGPVYKGSTRGDLYRIRFQLSLSRSQP